MTSTCVLISTVRHHGWIDLKTMTNYTGDNSMSDHELYELTMLLIFFDCPLACIQWCLDQGVDVNLDKKIDLPYGKMQHSKSLLLTALFCRKGGIARLLLKYGASCTVDMAFEGSFFDAWIIDQFQEHRAAKTFAERVTQRFGSMHSATSTPHSDDFDLLMYFRHQDDIAGTLHIKLFFRVVELITNYVIRARYDPTSFLLAREAFGMSQMRKALNEVEQYLRSWKTTAEEEMIADELSKCSPSVILKFTSPLKFKSLRAAFQSQKKHPVLFILERLVDDTNQPELSKIWYCTLLKNSNLEDITCEELLDSSSNLVKVKDFGDLVMPILHFKWTTWSKEEALDVLLKVVIEHLHHLVHQEEEDAEESLVAIFVHPHSRHNFMSRFSQFFEKFDYHFLLPFQHDQFCVNTLQERAPNELRLLLSGAIMYQKYRLAKLLVEDFGVDIHSNFPYPQLGMNPFLMGDFVKVSNSLLHKLHLSPTSDTVLSCICVDNMKILLALNLTFEAEIAAWRSPAGGTILHFLAEHDAEKLQLLLSNLFTGLQNLVYCRDINDDFFLAAISDEKVKVWCTNEFYQWNDFFFQACRQGNMTHLEHTLQQDNFLINAIDNLGNNALHHAARRGQQKVMKRLLPLASNEMLTAKNGSGMTPFECALESDNNDVVILLMEAQQERGLNE